MKVKTQKLYNSSNIGKNEQKSADKIEPKFKVGDWVVNKFGDSWHIDSLDNKNYQVSDGKGNYNYFPISKQDKMHLWTIQDAKDGDVLAASECYVVFKEIDGLNIKCYCTYHYLGLNPSFYRDTLQNKDAFLPATKEQRDAMMKAMNDAGYEWDAGNKELKKEKVKIMDRNEEQKSNDKKEYILCAAIKRKTPVNVESKNYKTNTLEDDDIYSIEIGRRHNDIMARFGKDALCLTQQGFYTSFGRFVSREEALQIAKEAGQVGETDDSRLYSEDLY